MKKQKKKKENFCFVIMPFGDWFNEYYEKIYCPAIKSAGLIPTRSDDLYRPSSIVQDIWSYTQNAKVILAELTDKNPNVFYELGLAHAIGKPAIFVTKTIEDVPFDLRGLRVIQYDTNVPDWGKVLQDNIKQAIKETLEAPEESIPPTFLGVKKTEAKVTRERRNYLNLESKVERLERETRSLSLHNSDRPIPPDEAEEFIKRYLRMGMPVELIANKLKHRGVPTNWSLEKIRELKMAQVHMHYRASS
ncbi:MAG: hypothetical protein PHG83_00095 [Patescibacteria group bacterium]|nr:hypothetical protein [Patescibacteria group bacterium]